MGVMLILAVAAWTIVIPFVVVRTCLDVSRASPQTYKPENGGRKRDKKAKQPGIPSSDDKNASLLGLVTAVCSVMCCLNVFYLILTSPNNSYAARAVLEAPLFTPEECQRILDFSYDAAQRNYDAAMETGDKQSKLLTKPIGWQKSRHSLYPTTDLNLVVDPFTAEAREYIGHRLDARLAPLLERVFGITPGAIRANDMFVVRYDAEVQPFLALHTDDSDISFNVLLSSDFEGGGTQFWNRLQNAPFAYVKPKQVGQVLVHSALIQHEGMPVTKGVRHILVGFLAVDHVDPLTAQATGLSWFASWLSLPFLHVKAKDGYVASHTRLRAPSKQHKWTDNKYMRSLFRDIVNIFEWVGDTLAPHFHASLVQEKDAKDYLTALDEAFEAKAESPGVASWFHGQMISRDADGTATRRDSADAFRDL
jgi:hypothetical protein